MKTLVNKNLFKYFKVIINKREFFACFGAKSSKSSGFTLMELLVAFTLFTIVMSILTSIFIISNKTQRNIAELILVNDNTYLSIEQMARSIRDGKDFDFVHTCFPSCFSFTDRNGHTILFDFAENGITKADLTLPPPGDTPKKITADNVDVVSFLVTPNNCSDEDLTNPPVRLTLSLVVRPKSASAVSGFENKIQTTVSSRNLLGCNINP